MINKDGKRQIAMWIPAELYDKLQSKASEKCIPLSALVKMVCAEYITAEEAKSLATTSR